MTLLDMLGATPVRYYLMKLRGWVSSGLYAMKRGAGGCRSRSYFAGHRDAVCRSPAAQRPGLVENFGSHVREEQHIPDRR